jgi:hypothetical protein
MSLSLADIRGLVPAWLILAMINAPVWIWLDGRYGVVKAIVFALAFLPLQQVKKNLFDVALFSLIMTAMHVFSREVLNYHQLVFETYWPQMLLLMLHIELTLLAAYFHAWLFQLGSTEGVSYPRYAVWYVTIYLGGFILHALYVEVTQGYAIGAGKLGFNGLTLLLPYIVWRANDVLWSSLAQRHAGRVSAVDRRWRIKLRDFENTKAVLISCLALYALQVFWFSFVYFAIGKLGLEKHFSKGDDCGTATKLTDFSLFSLASSIGSDSACLGAASLFAKATVYCQVIITVFLLLIVLQALALARRASTSDKP